MVEFALRIILAYFHAFSGMSSTKRLTISKLKKVAVQIEDKNVSPKKKAKIVPDKSIYSSEKNEKWTPKDWETQLTNIVKMREKRDAPVDLMGAECCYDNATDPKSQRLQVLLSLMLSSQTKDNVTSSAMKRLIENGCTIDKLRDLTSDQIGALITPVGFWRKKSEYILKTVEILHSDFDDDIPDNLKQLCDLPGVGPKMAYLTMQIAWGNTVGIGVDTHVHRIANRLEWVSKSTKDPEKTRKELEDWLPK